MTTNVLTPTAPAVQQKPNFSLWKEQGETLFQDFRTNEKNFETSQWEIGQWILDGVNEFSKQKAYDVAEEITGFDREYLHTVVWVVKRFDSSLRKETKLKWSHFKELAYIEDDDLRGKVLKHFSDGGDWTVRAVREHVREELDKLKGQNSGKKEKSSKLWVSMSASLQKGYRERIKELAKVRDVAPDDLLGKIVMEYFDANTKSLNDEIKKAKEKKATKKKAKR